MGSLISSFLANHTHIVGTGALIKVSCGFEPCAIFVVNYTDVSLHIWFAGMPQDTAFEIRTGVTVTITAADALSTYAGGEQVFAATNPVIDFDTAAALPEGSWSAPGFTIGTDGNLNAVNDQLKCLVLRDVPVKVGANADYPDEDP